MASLALSIAAAPFRGLVVTGDGSRMLVRGLDDPPNDSILSPSVFVDRHGAEVGRRAGQAAAGASNGVRWWAAANQAATVGAIDERDGGEWTGRDLFALVLRRALLAAERTCGEAVNHLTLVTPSGLDEANQRALEAAAHLAGAAEVELIDVGALMVGGPEVDIGQRHLLIQFDADQMRISLFRAGAAGPVLEASADLSDDWAGSRLARRLSAQVAGPGVAAGIAQSFLERVLPLWGAGPPPFDLAASGVGAPEPLFLPLEAIDSLADTLLDQIRAVIVLKSIDPSAVHRVHLQGRWSEGLAPRFRKLFNRAQVVTATTAGAVLERLTPAPRPRPQMATTVFADHPRDLRVANAQPATRILLSPDAPLPAGFADESFPTHLFYDRVGLFARDDQDRVSALGEIAVPRLFEQRSFAMVRVRVTADTPRFLLLQAELALAQNTVTLLFDKQSATTAVVPPAVMRALQRQEAPVQQRARLGG